MNLITTALGFALGPLKPWLIGLAAAAALAGVAWEIHLQREIGRDEIRAEWNKEKLEQARVDLAASEANARETLRRTERQQENQRVQEQELAAAHAAADRNGHESEQLREQNAGVAKQWRDALAHPTSGSVCPAAGDAIGVLADVLGRADRRAGLLAAYADAAHVAGLKCERDYDALTVKP